MAEREALEKKLERAEREALEKKEQEKREVADNMEF